LGRIAKKGNDMITHYPDLVQGSDEWLAARLGLITASEMKLILTPTLKIANNDKTHAHVWELAAQRLTGYVEPHYVGNDMLRGFEDEVKARELYSDLYAPAVEAGFYTNDEWGFTIGYSPDGTVGADGLIECKSRRQKYQVQTISEGVVPDEYMLQIQTGLLVTGRKWLDFISYSGGLPMFVARVLPDSQMQAAIIEAARDFEGKVQQAVKSFQDNCRLHNYPATVRTIEQEMTV
jgi:predicted phage-related endonuclease